MVGTIKENLDFYRSSFPRVKDVTLVAVSKFKPVEIIKEAYDAGQRVFGESRVNELISKAESLPGDIRWHFIGHLQTNKVARLLTLPNLELIQSVDSVRLLELIDNEAAKRGRKCDVLLELHVAKEDSKFGFNPDELIEWFRSGALEKLLAVHIKGLMGMATNTEDKTVVRKEFEKMASTFKAINDSVPELRGFNVLSMGMTDDYLIAIDEGSNMVRIGSGIFGDR